MSKNYRWIWLRILLLIAVYSVLRIFFLVWNWAEFSSEPLSQVMISLLHGIRFDISAVMIISSPFILIWLFASALTVRYRHMIDGLYWVLHFVFFSMNVADSELVRFNGQRMTWTFFELSQDISRQFGQLMVYYWPQTLFTLFCSYCFWKFQPRPEPLSFNIRSSTLTATTIFLVALGIRGGTQNKPLKPAHAYGASSARLGTLALNSTFTVIHSRRAVGQQRYHFMDDSTACELATVQSQDFHPALNPDQPQNVVVLILESFALEYMGKVNGRKGYTPFLDELASRGGFFTEGFANGRRSIEAMPSIVANVPSLLSEPFLMSGYQGLQIRGLPEILYRHGYSSAFFHGAINGSMFFDSFAARAGYQKYYGRDEFNGNPETDDDGFWGVLDEPFLQFAASTINKMPQPFFSTIFTLSSHQPYPVPPQYKSVLPTGELPIHQSISYADLALRKFFETAQTMPWYENTLFVITADHTQENSDPRYKNMLGEFRVPIILFHPKHQIKVDPSRPVQHVDIAPTISDLLDIEDKFGRIVGRSAFGPKDQSLVVNRDINGYWGISNGHLVVLNFDGNAKISPYPDVSNFSSKSAVALAERSVKAFVQCFVGRVLDGQLDDDRQRADDTSIN